MPTNTTDSPQTPDSKGKSFIPIILYSACGLFLVFALASYIYNEYFSDQRAINLIKDHHFDNAEMQDAKTLNGLEVVAAVSPKEKLALLDGLTQAKAAELVLKVGQSDINAVALFKTAHPLINLAYGTNCAGHYKYTFVTPARVASPELLMKPAVKANVHPDDQESNPYLDKMPIIYTDALYESRVSYIFHAKDGMHPIKEGSEEEMLDISLCLEGGKDELNFAPLDEASILEKEQLYKDELEIKSE